MAKSAAELGLDQFCQAFLPCREFASCMKPLTQVPLGALQKADSLSEAKLSKLFIETVNTTHILSHATVSRFPSPEENRKEAVRTDAAIFRHNSTSVVTTPSWTDQIVPVAFSPYFPGGDPFDRAVYDDPYGAIEAERKRVFDRISTIVDVLFAAQQRVFVFVLLVIGRSFRLIRWDRAGAIVTSSVDYYTNPTALLDCLQRISALDDSTLGFDPSASRVLPGDVDFLRMDIAALEHSTDEDHSERDLDREVSGDRMVFRYARTLFRSSLATDWPRHKLRVPCGSSWRYYLVGKPTFRADGAIGRGTRGYVALNCETRRFVWLKDAWRAAYMISCREGDVLEKLNEAGVENVPTLVCHGDIDDQVTVTADWWGRDSERPSSAAPSTSSSQGSPTSSATLVESASSGSRKRKRGAADEATLPPPGDERMRNLVTRSDHPLRQHQHYRIVVKEVAFSLRNVQNGRQLASVVLDTVQAHCQAATNPKTLLLHRDISAGNILIYPRVRHGKDGTKRAIVWTGILCDWELAKPVDDQRAPSNAPRTSQMGTYQFMSVNLLSNPSSPSVTIADELESFFHVLFYYSLRYLRSNCESPDSYITNYFNSYAGPGGLHSCGWKSLTFQVDDFLSLQFPHSPLLFNSPMDDLLEAILKCFRSHYKLIRDDLRKAMPPPRRRTPPPPESPGKRMTFSVSDIVFFGDDANEVDEDDAFDKYRPADNTPSEEDRALARKIMDHKFMLEYMTQTLRDTCWPEDDRIPERQNRPSTAVKPVAPADTSRPQHGSHKKRRIAGPERTHATLPIRLHGSTRRLRSSARTAPVSARS
ncbi:hypothetical protein DICSQDRAFT_170785 [Dichomitus squalens LYAD-421 SS1]|uniref:Fungal-type protein kinase domain-containing protein n=1 Tax=Dichomitus squalens (strain LYAD-421) TaxID=732165 RepID=R7SXL8_DICSQ|nr:uncharacterized protein DICSQDRAFT_170785 [Dichomitus squalens LYAD-421 SS1]EJF60929.1 hypothetical protein DICSQDRAFT_170785 [Dichomitus squalens LYAD-421 SS1]